jgi:phenylalanine-4-hydroxylase
MSKIPAAPTRGSLELRGAYAHTAPDYTVTQDWDKYTDDEHLIWRTLYLRQRALLERYAAPDVIAGLDALGIDAEHIPRFNSVNALLAEKTGWRIVAVPGLIPEEHFFAHLAAKSFPVSVWIRKAHEMDYLSEPDLFHDFFGHVPLLANPVFARFMQAYGAAGEKAQLHDAVNLLARVYWYTVEFGLINTPQGLRAYGAGILSSKGETVYSIESHEPNRIAFDLRRVMCTDYRIDNYQRLYFVIDGFEQLFHAGYNNDFGPLYDDIGPKPDIPPERLLPTDKVITQGTVAARPLPDESELAH